MMANAFFQFIQSPDLFLGAYNIAEILLETGKYGPIRSPGASCTNGAYAFKCYAMFYVHIGMY